MNKTLLFICLLFCILCSAQQNKIIFGYDLAGNQTSRVLCLGACTGKQVKEVKEIEALVEQDMQKFLQEDNFSYYPNPVREELFIRWETVDSKLTSINVYGISGQVLRSFSELQNATSQNIPFQQYPTGVYLVALRYSNGDQKTIKIIKQ